MSQKQVKFENAMEDDDFGLIIGKDGELKGLFVPEEYDAMDYVPHTIVEILKKVYGIDVSEEVTMH